MNELNNETYKNITLITSGSQLGLVSNYLEYSSNALNIKQWYNLNNPKDLVFARHPITTTMENFNEIETSFKKGIINHDVLEYINHTETIKKVWKKLLM